MDGVYHVKDSTGEEVTDVFPVEEFFNDYHELVVSQLLLFPACRLVTLPHLSTYLQHSLY